MTAVNEQLPPQQVEGNAAPPADLSSGLAPGRIVHYVMKDGEVRPLIVVRCWTSLCVNGLLFYDGGNDRERMPNEYLEAALETQGIKHVHLGVVWVTSACYSAALTPGTWHWPVASAANSSTTAMAQIAAVLDEHMKSVEDRLALHIQTVNKLLDSHSVMVRDVLSAQRRVEEIGAKAQAAVEEVAMQAGKAEGLGESTSGAQTGSPEVATDIPSAETNGN